MSEEKAQESVQDSQAGAELAAESQSVTDSSGQSELLREVMAKKEKIKGLESKLAEIEAKESKRRQEQMAAEGKKDELIAELQDQVAEFKPFKERLDSYEASRRKVLLERLPENKREKFESHPLDVLEDLADEYSAGTVAKVDNSTPGKFGGYESMVDWATNDPKGYKKANRSTKGIKIGYSD